MHGAFLLTVGRQLDHELVVVCLGTGILAFDASLVLVPKHLGAMATGFELVIVRLQALDDAAVFLWTHASQLWRHTHTHTVGLEKRVLPKHESDRVG